MSQVLFEKDVMGAWASEGFGALLAGSLISLVFVALSGFMIATDQAMTDSLESFVYVSIPIGVLLALVFGGFAFRVRSRGLRRLVLSRETSGLVLAIGHDIRIEGELELSRGWFAPPGQRGMKMLWCDVREGTKVWVRLTADWGAFVDLPEGWTKKQPPMEQRSEHGGYKLSSLPELVNAFETS